jgi:hypothetical protein
MYAIICDARYGHDLGINVLALTSDKNEYWTSDKAHNIRVLKTKESADLVVKNFKYNNPRVVELKDAEAMINEQSCSITWATCDSNA